MGPLYSSQNTLVLDGLRVALAQEGIACEVRQRHLAPLAGAIPVNEAWTELWLLDETRREEAERLVAVMLDEGPASAGPVASSWTCPRCGEVSPPELSECWQCTVSEVSSDAGRPLAAPGLWKPLSVVLVLAFLLYVFMVGR